MTAPSYFGVFCKAPLKDELHDCQNDDDKTDEIDNVPHDISFVLIVGKGTQARQDLFRHCFGLFSHTFITQQHQQREHSQRNARHNHHRRKPVAQAGAALRTVPTQM